MIPLTVAQLVDAVSGTLVQGDPGASIETVSIDSRRISGRCCFVAIVGANHDAHDFIGDAVDAGAAAIVAHRPVDAAPGVAVVRVDDTTAALQALGSRLRRISGVRVAAITGSVGKTTTKHLTAALLATRWRVRATPGNLNNHWGVPLSLLRLREEDEVMVVELAMSRAGEIARLTEIARPDVGLITNVAPAHMENFSDLDAVAAAKAELAEGLASDATLVVNADDPRVRAIGERFEGSVAGVVRYGRDREADVRAAHARRVDDGWTLDLALPDGSSETIEMKLPGEHSVSNFLAAAAIAHLFDVPIDAMASAAPSLDLPGSRGGIIDLPDGIRVVDETYNASPLAMQRAVEMLADLRAEGRRVLVAGDMLELGAWSERSHRELGSLAAAAGIDVFVAVGSRAADAAETARRKAPAGMRVELFDDAPEAAGWLAGELRWGDVVLVKGSRAMGMERIVSALLDSNAEAPAAAAEEG